MGMFGDQAGDSNSTVTSLTNPAIGLLGTFGTGKWAIYSANDVFTVPANITLMRVRGIGLGGDGGDTAAPIAKSAVTFGSLISITPGGNANGASPGVGGVATIDASGIDTFSAVGGSGGVPLLSGSGANIAGAGGGGGGAGSQLGKGGRGGDGSFTVYGSSIQLFVGGGGGGVNNGAGNAGGGGSAFGPATQSSGGPDINGNQITSFTGEYHPPNGYKIRFAFDGFVGGGAALGKGNPYSGPGIFAYFLTIPSAGGGGGGAGAWTFSSSGGSSIALSNSSPGGYGGGGGGGASATNGQSTFASNGGIGGGGGGSSIAGAGVYAGGGGGGYAHATFAVTQGTQYAITIPAQPSPGAISSARTIGGMGMFVVEY